MTTVLMDTDESGLEIKLAQYMRAGCWAKQGHPIRRVDRNGEPRYFQELIYTGDRV